MMLTQNGKLLYISDNAAEYLGHSMVSLWLSTIKLKYLINDIILKVDKYIDGKKWLICSHINQYLVFRLL